MKKIIFVFLFFLNCHEALAQQTIFNVPSADITPKNKNFIQHESQFRAKDPDQFLNTTNYYARGIGHDIELDATLFNLASPASNNVSLGLGFKSSTKIQENNFSETRMIFGSQIPFSLQGNGVGYWVYGAPSVALRQSGTRITAGISSGTKQIFGESVTCFIGGFEQRITNKLNLIADWYSGNHALGLMDAGFSYALPQEFVFYGGYQIPNSRKAGRNGFVVEISKIF